MFSKFLLSLIFVMAQISSSESSTLPESQGFSSGRILPYENRSIRGDGVLSNILDEEFGFRGLKLPGGLEIANLDDTLYATLYVENKSHELYFVRKNKRFIPKVRAFFPEYDVLVMDAKRGSGGSFLVFIDGAWRKVTSNQLFFHKWDDFLLKFSTFIPFSQEPFVLYRKKGGARGVVIDSAESYSFVFKKIDGDWAYVACDVDCEGCPDGAAVEGWIKWKHIDQLMVDLRYVC
jgi:hypothetical protein